MIPSFNPEISQLGVEIPQEIVQSTKWIGRNQCGFWKRESTRIRVFDQAFECNTTYFIQSCVVWSTWFILISSWNHVGAFMFFRPKHGFEWRKYCSNTLLTGIAGICMDRPSIRQQKPKKDAACPFKSLCLLFKRSLKRPDRLNALKELEICRQCNARTKVRSVNYEAISGAVNEIDMFNQRVRDRGCCWRWTSPH